MRNTEMEMVIRPSKLSGEIAAPPSKSYTHRAMICASLASGKSTLYHPLISEDTEATLEACKAIGAKVLKKSNEEIVIDGTKGRVRNESDTIDCMESGSTLRFILPILALSENETIVTGRRGLSKRPVAGLLKAIEHLGGRVEYLGEKGSIPVRISGGALDGGSVKIRGDLSSQFISGLLFALPLAEGTSKIQVTTKMESVDYVKMTIEVLEKFGISIQPLNGFNGYRIKGGQTYIHRDYSIEGDFSSASFMLVAGALSAGESGLTVTNLKENSNQGDRKIVDILKRMGADIAFGDSLVRVSKSSLRGTVVDARNIPDLVPIIAVAASQATSGTTIKNVERLKIKESNRLTGTLKVMEAFGCRVEQRKGSLIFKGSDHLTGCHVPKLDDHRLVMAACIAGLAANGETLVKNPLAIKKSYPGFFDDVRSSGGDVTVLSNTSGNFLKLRLIGESHGKRIGAILEGVPKGISIKREFIQGELEKRRSTGQLTTSRREDDEVEIISGIENNQTTGNPIRLEIQNKDVKSETYERTKGIVRPGHADYTAREKYASVFDYRGGGFLSGRMTACLVAAGAVAKKALEPYGIKVLAHTVGIGGIKVTGESSDEDVEKNALLNSVRCADLIKAREMEEAIKRARLDGDSLGGVTECRILGVPVGVGEPFFHSIESEISQSVFAIPAVKGIEFGSGFSGAEKRGSDNNDPVTIRNGRIITLTNNSGGILGGISNGMPIVFRVAVKPTSSIAKEQQTINHSRFEVTKISVKGRHDPCIAVRIPPVIEAMAALTVMDLMMAGGMIGYNGEVM